MLHSAAQAPAGRTVVADLWTGEQLTLFAVRDWSREAGCGPRTECVFRNAFGLAGVERALELVEEIMAVLAAAARRPFRPYCAVCSLVSPDESSLLTLVAAAQLGDETHAAASARWLARPGAQARLLATASLFAADLKGRHLYLPLRTVNGQWRSTSPAAADPTAAAKETQQNRRGFSKPPC